MSDQEWDRWKATFKREDRPMPNVMKRARSDRKRALLGLTAVYAIFAIEMLAQLPTIRHARSLGDLFAPIGVFAAMVFIVVGMHVAMRGTLGRDDATPRALLDGMEKRHRARLRLAALMPWTSAVVVAITLAIAARDWILAGGIDPVSAVACVAVCGIVIGTSLLFVRRLRAFLVRELEQIALARRDLDEGNDG